MLRKFQQSKVQTPDSIELLSTVEHRLISYQELCVATKYDLEGRVSMKCDIYSYGIMLLEIFTRKRPTDEMFAGELSLRQLVKGSLPNSIAEAVDGNLLRLIEGSENMIAYLLLILEVGLECCAELPEERINIKDVVTKLSKIKLQLVRDGHT
ncbi:putative LRR receptor-like serine/threonine-protein kinase [Camellia lanceoleosa]|uniref:LRR receptor-like serine/threonine-protein kinase n=1 Tax=Camellia lanceoleosa TaxID=1840588 RepID=A0ACC0HVF1_9ERIC|nr:putative LRR receptor-like serine/threonine-protein kinase [Camellia lanceoleosa]